MPTSCSILGERALVPGRPGFGRDPSPMNDYSLTFAPEEHTRSHDQLRLLIDVSEAIATHRDLSTLCRELARRLPSVVPFDLVALFLHDPDRNVMRVHMLGGADGDRIPPGLEVPVDASFSGLAMMSQQPVVVRSREEAARWMDGGHSVDGVAIPPAIFAWVGEYVENNYRPQPQKRFKPRSFQHPKDRV